MSKIKRYYFSDEYDLLDEVISKNTLDIIESV